MREGARQIAATLREHGHQALWAGGCVRDLVLGRIPKDYDIATDATPDAVMRLFPNAVAVGKAFGVILAPWLGHNYEVATFRSDLGYSDGRRPDAVRFSDARADAERRDFTINAMFMNPLDETVLDYAGGMDDLKARLIRCVGDPEKRLGEDMLRMLRAVRFASTLGFTIESGTMAAIRRHAPGIRRISAERIRQEFERILTESLKPGDALRLMDEAGLLEIILPEVAAMKGQEQPPQFHPEGDVFTHTVIMLNDMERPSPRLAFACLLHDVGKPACARQAEDRLRFHGHAQKSAEMAETIMTRLKMPTDDIKAVVYCIANHMRFMEVTRMRRSTLLKLTSQPTFPLELEMHRLDCLASHGDISNHEFLVRFTAELHPQRALPKPFVSGEDIMKMGVPQGPAVGEWKHKAFEAQLEGVLRDREHALEWLAAAMRDSTNNPAAGDRGSRRETGGGK